MRGLLALAALTLGLAEAAPLTIRFLDVGQGDAILITSPEGKSVLYGGGRSEPRMLSMSVAVATDARSKTGSHLKPWKESTTELVPRASAPVERISLIEASRSGRLDAPLAYPE